MKFWLQRLQDIVNIYTDIYPPSNFGCSGCKIFLIYIQIYIPMKFWLQRLQNIFNIYTDIYPP